MCFDGGPHVNARPDLPPALQQKYISDCTSKGRAAMEPRAVRSSAGECRNYEFDWLTVGGG
jgi:hypothetical protein